MQKRSAHSAERQSFRTPDRAWRSSTILQKIERRSCREINDKPPLLFGKDLEAEQVVDRETRVLRTGNACFLTVIAVMPFIAFMGGQQGFIDHRFEVWGLEALWIVLFALARLYARHLARTPLTS